MISPIQTQVPKPVTTEWLTEKFGPAVPVALFGECLVIPGSDFNPAWEVDLGDQGYRCHFGSYENRAVTFVPTKKAVAPGKVVYVPPPKTDAEATTDQVNVNGGEKTETIEEKKNAEKAEEAEVESPQVPETVETEVEKEKPGFLQGPIWTSEDEAELLKAYDQLVSEGKKYSSYKIIAEQPRFKERSYNAIAQKLKKLLKKRGKTSVTGPKAEKVEKAKKRSFVEKFDDFIVELWQGHKTYAEIMQAVVTKFPGKHPSVDYRISVLQQKKRISPRQVERRKAESKKDSETSDAENIEAENAEKVKVTRRETLRQRGGNLWPKIWTLEEDKLLIELWSKTPHLTVSQISAEFHAKFPDTKRTSGAIGNRLSGLQNEKQIQPRWIIANPEKAKVTKSTEPTEPTQPTQPAEPPAEEPPQEAEPTGSPERTVSTTGILDLENKVQVLSETCKSLRAYIDLTQNSINKAHAELTVEFEHQMKISHPVLAEHEQRLTDLTDTFITGLCKHKHAVSGEAMLPMELEPKQKLTHAELQKLRLTYCTTDELKESRQEDGTEELCCNYQPKGLTKICEESCPSFCKLYAELQKLMEASD
jgi:hypothetical protein